MELTDRLIKSICSSTIYKRGMEYFRQGRVHIKRRDDNSISAAVDGEEIYNVQIKMDDEKITGYFCSCPYYDTMNISCKHIVATLLQRQSELMDGHITDDNDRLTTGLCHAFGALDEEKQRLHVSFEVSMLNKGFGKWDYDVRIRVEGKTIDTPSAFFKCIEERRPFKISRYVEYAPESCYFGEAEEKILNVLTESSESQRLSDGFYSNTDNVITVGTYAMKRIFDLLPLVDYSIVFNRMGVGRIPIEKDNPDILIDVSASDGEIILYCGSYGTAIVPDGKIMYFDDKIYITDTKWQKWFMPIYNVLARDCRTQLSFKGENAMSFASFVLPVIGEKHGVVTDGIEETVINERPEFFVYLDAKAREVLCTVKASYGDISLILPEAAHSDKKIIVRDIASENKLLKLLDGFEYRRGYYRIDDNERLFDFLKNGLDKLRDISSVMVSDSFSKIKIHSRIGLTSSISYNDHDNLLEATLESDLSYDEIRDILSAIKLKKSFYRLADGSFADLEEEQKRLEMFGRIGFDAQDLLEEKKILPRYQMLYLNAVSEIDNGIKVDESVTEYVEQIKTIKAKIPSELKNILRGYQKEGINWLKQLSELGLGGILADDMGLGKTLQIIAFLYGEKPEKPVLIVAPSSLTYNWKNEISKFIPKATALIIDGNGAEREELIEKFESNDFLITSYPLLRRDIDKYEDIEFSYCIIDEAQSIKNPRTINALSVKRIRAEHKFALTGTPIENSLSELWSVFDFLMPGYLYRYSDFKEWFETPIVRDSDESALEELKAKISPFILRRMKKDVLSELPDKIENVVYADMIDEQKQMYAAFQAIAKDRTLAILHEGQQKMEILTLLTRLRQISCHPALFDSNYKKDSGKLQVLIELVTTAVPSGHRILVFSQFTSMLAIIKEKLKAEKIDCFYLDGSTPPYMRSEYADRFNGGERSVFLISLKAGGFGLNLIGADMVIHYDPWWNPAVTEQASDRAYRIGQTKNVQVIKLASKDTIEEKILRLQESKKKLADDVINNDVKGLAALSASEILALFD